MKKLFLLFLLPILSFSVVLTSCEKIADDLQDSVELTVNTTLEVPITAVPSATKSATDNGFTFNESGVLDMANNADLAQHLNKLKSISVQKITILVTSVSSSNLILENSTFTITDNVNGESFSYSTPLNTPIVVGSLFTIDSNTAGFEKVSGILNARHAATVSAVGQVNQSDFTIGFLYGVDVKAVVNP